MSSVRILQLRDADQLRPGETAVVVDVLRASTTIAVALSQGASRVHPVRTPAAARELARELDDPVLVGERDRGQLDGFVDNSPAKLASMDLEGQDVVLTTTNGTGALHAAQKTAGRVIAGSLVNASRLAEALADEPVALVAAGWRGEPAGDDDACCEYLAARLRGEAPDIDPYLQRLEASTSAVSLREHGKADDVDICLSLDAAPVLPELEDGSLRARELV